MAEKTLEKLFHETSRTPITLNEKSSKLCQKWREALNQKNESRF
jgi:hypothetical protein